MNDVSPPTGTPTDRVRALEARVSRERESLRTVRVERDRAVLEAEQLKARFDKLDQCVVELRHELDCVYSGRSWRLTRPLRWVLAGLRRTATSATENDGVLDVRAFGELSNVDRERELAAMIDGSEGGVGSGERQT